MINESEYNILFNAFLDKYRRLKLNWGGELIMAGNINDIRHPPTLASDKVWSEWRREKIAEGKTPLIDIAEIMALRLMAKEDMTRNDTNN